jgi:hypothetical protein
LEYGVAIPLQSSVVVMHIGTPKIKILSRGIVCRADLSVFLISWASVHFVARRVKTIIEGVFKIESYDRILDGGVCTKKRPDFVIKGLYRDLVLEVDERQHSRGKKYGPDCEYNRMWDIAQALGIATVFVRYNPDPFIDSEGKRRDPVTADREKILISWIKTLLSREPPKESFVTAVYLYYDGFDSPEKAAEEILMDPMNGFTKPVEFLPAEVLTCENLELLFTAFNIE